jgi:hypothetical protein
MELWMTVATGNAEFAVAFETARGVIEPAFNQRFLGNAHGTGLIELQYRALLHLHKQRTVGETKRYMKMSHTVQLTARVELPLPCQSDIMVERLATSLARAFERLKSLNIAGFDSERFSADYVEFATGQRWVLSTPVPSSVGAGATDTPCTNAAPPVTGDHAAGAPHAVSCAP